MQFNKWLLKTCIMTTTTKTAKELISDLNVLRGSIKRISDFKNISEWLSYNADYAQKHASILHQIASLNN